jgi:hypothetical protein
VAASKWFAIAMTGVAMMTGCSPPVSNDNAQTLAKPAVSPSFGGNISRGAAWMNLTTAQIQALADQALSCDGNVHRVGKCAPDLQGEGKAWVDFDRNDPRIFDSINLSFEVSEKGLAAEPLAQIPPKPTHLIRFFFPEWRSGATWLRYAVKHSQGQCPMQVRLSDADVSVIGQYRYDPRDETEAFVVELRIYRRSAHAEQLLDQCIREEVTDSSEVRSHALANGMSIEQALKLNGAAAGS